MRATPFPLLSLVLLWKNKRRRTGWRCLPSEQVLGMVKWLLLTGDWWFHLLLGSGCVGTEHAIEDVDWAGPREGECLSQPRLVTFEFNCMSVCLVAKSNLGQGWDWTLWTVTVWQAEKSSYTCLASPLRANAWIACEWTFTDAFSSGFLPMVFRQVFPPALLAQLMQQLKPCLKTRIRNGFCASSFWFCCLRSNHAVTVRSGTGGSKFCS